jgi:glucose-1-phosphate adenylyltransferase
MINVLGIVNYDDASVSVAGLDSYRPVPSLSFLARYRLIDFALSNMTNSGIKRIQVYVKHKPRSIIEHLGSGRQYNINSKHGKLRILTGEDSIQSEAYNHDITAFIQNMRFIEDATQEYVMIVPSHMIYTVDFSEVYKQHLETKADVTVLYKTVNNAHESFMGVDTLKLDDKKHVLEIEKNRGKYKNRHISLAAYMMSRELFIHLIHLADNLSSLYTLRDVLQEQAPLLNMMGYQIKGYVACINSLKEYFRVNLELTDYDVAKELFQEDWPIHTRTSDSCPAQYAPSAKVNCSIVANGCFIEGTVVHSVIGRGVVIKKGALVENSIVLEGSVIGENVHLKNVVVDKSAVVSKVKELVSDESKILYVKRQDRV